ncbi:ATP-binding protein [Myxococcota bacterium]|nr:ATP-binding protein [Myxococcota bacterium]MBU1382584.1 ATP-binding protein [Myxococcota bacterium]MBU1495801.1 ATP-binding protein [Myxococcota bacterium]
MYISRTIEEFLRVANTQFPVLVVTGPRQTGKTTLLRHIAEEERAYVTLDDPLLRSLAYDDPQLFLQRFPAPVLIDEIQYVPELLTHIKIKVDTEQKAGMYWLTGSQQFHLMEGVSESLAGRAAILNLSGFSSREIQGRPRGEPFIGGNEIIATTDLKESLKFVFDRIWRGSYPAMWTENSPDWELYYSSYLQTYLHRDVKNLINAGDERSFIRFLRTCAARTSQMLNINELCRDADINHATGKRWLSILESAGIIYLLEPYHSNINKRLMKTPKLFFMDTGLAAYLLHWSSPDVLESGAMSGAFFETFVVTEILKSWWHNGKRPPINWYRDKDGKEIDLIITKGDVIHPVEIKKSANPSKEDIRHFRVLNSLGMKIGAGSLICLADRKLPLNDYVQIIPTIMI